ncbi:MAG: hypothetical protein IT436_08830 [Phycisphaerales bacterium]|nr:hypothetical protein [Phycisphaerales bacterium]
MLPLWISMSLVVVMLVMLDRFLLHPRPEVITPTTAVARLLFWFLLAMVFNAGVFFIYEEHNFGAGLDGGVHHVGGVEASLQFLTAFVLALALDLDTVFVISAIFTHLRTPAGYRHRVLFWGIPAAMVGRGIMIFTAGELLDLWGWFRFVLAVLLILAGLRMILIRQENADPEKNFIYRILRRFVPVSDRQHGADLLALVNGRPALTPLLVTLLLVETADGIFAFDSIPAAFAVTREPFLIFAANVFSLFCLRAIYPALESLTGWLRYVKIGLAMILAYAAVAIALPVTHRAPTEASLAAILASVGVGISFAVRWGSARQAKVRESPLGPDAERIARLTLAPARKLIVLVVGTTVVIIGLIMIGPVPGPGIVVVPIGLSILAAEFVWARRLLHKYSQSVQSVGRRVMKTPRPWLIVPVVGATLAIFTLLWVFRPFEIRTSAILSGAIPALLGQIVWAYLTIQKYREIKRTPGPDAGK